MKIIVFTGPTLTPEEGQGVLPGAIFRAPAECGDVYRACAEQPDALCLIDGYFDQRLSVWHKEVLWALTRGVRVYGAASMGALRAAELEPFGMVGVGRIFEWYRDGVLERDDEVAVLHESAEHGYRAVSEALVNIRATLERAVADAAIPPSVADVLLEIGRGLFYPDRSLRAISRLGSERGVLETHVSALAAFVARHGRVDQKRLDALALLERVRADLAARVPAQQATFHFAYTELWHELRRRLDRAVAPQPPAAVASGVGRTGVINANVGALLAALERVEAGTSLSLWQRATTRALALALAEQCGVSADPRAVQDLSERFRLRYGLIEPEQTRAWLASQRLDLESFSALMHDEALVQGVQSAVERVIEEQVVLLLAAEGKLGELLSAPFQPQPGATFT